LRYINKHDSVIITGILILILVSGLTGYNYAHATLSTNNSSTLSQFSCEQQVNFVIAEDNAVPPNYYSISGESTPTVPCGKLVYGGSINAGSVTGSNFSAVIDSTINALFPTSTSTGGSIFIEPGTYFFTHTIIIPNFSGALNHGGLVISGQSYENTVLNYTGSTTTHVLWSPYTGTTQILQQESISINNIKLTIGTINYGGKAVDLSNFAIVTINNFYINYALANPANDGLITSTGFILAHTLGIYANINSLYVLGFGIDAIINNDHTVCTQCEFNAYENAGLQLGNQTALGATDETFINPHFFNDPYQVTTFAIGTYIRFNFTGGARALVTMINLDSEQATNPYLDINLFNDANSWLKMITADWTPGGLAYPPLIKYPSSGRTDGISFSIYQPITTALATPFCNAGSSVFNIGVDCGTAAPNTGQLYASGGIPLSITVTGGTVTSILIETQNGNTIASLGTTVQGYILLPGEAVKFTYTGSPVFSIYAVGGI
jgi:hypothetical protein